MYSHYLFLSIIFKIYKNVHHDIFYLLQLFNV